MGAPDALLQAINLVIPPDIDARYSLSEQVPLDQRPVFIVSDDLSPPLRRRLDASLADVRTVTIHPDGRPDVAELVAVLQSCTDRPLRMGVFPLVSASTAGRLNHSLLSETLHQHGALVCFDATSALPDVPVFMQPPPELSGGPLDYADVLLIDPSTLPGAVGCPGILAARRLLVDPLLGDAQRRGIDGPWSGAPDHAPVLRTALAFRLRTAINPQLMLPWLQRRVSAAWRSWSGVPGLVLHGSPHAPRVATVHLPCDTDHGRVPGSLLLTVLDDVFGVQAREVDGQPDRIAVDFSWIHSNTTSSYIVDAVAAVCRDGAALLDGYVPDGEAWRWPCTGSNTDLSLGDVVVRAGILEVHADRTIAGEDVLADQLRRGQAVLTGETSGARHTA